MDAELRVSTRRSSEPGVPARAHGPRPRVPADLQFELETPHAERQGLQSAAAEGPTQPAQLTPHRHGGLALFDDLPRLVEAESVYGRWRQVRMEPHFAVVRRDTAIRKAPRPRNHRVAAPVESRLARPGVCFREDPLDAGDY